MTDDDRPKDGTAPPVRNDPMEADARRRMGPPEHSINECRDTSTKAPLDQFADLVFSAENALLQMKFGWEHPADIHACLKELQGKALHDIPQFFPNPARLPLAAEVAEAAAAWLTYWGHNTINLEAARALKEEDDHA
ncbi:MAG TPA: hypothetical protein VK196_06490 [Magnetospirillum sp.]|nr:hypothetical protein [Magnetospirillum sp.]